MRRLRRHAILPADPPLARIPDVSVIRADSGDAGRDNHTPASRVVLAVEVVSAGTQTADRRDKPVEYAAAGIPAFWRIEVEPDIEVVTHRLVGERYEETGRFHRGDAIDDPTLPWAQVDVTALLGYFA